MDLEKAKRDLEDGKDIQPNGCWFWRFARNENNYGVVRNNGKLYKVHRLSAHVYLGFDIESGLQVRHKCDNPPCFNPDCLIPDSTQADNMRDKAERGRDSNKNKTHCINGHEYTVENTYIRRDDGSRQCNTCIKIGNKERSDLRSKYQFKVIKP